LFYLQNNLIIIISVQKYLKQDLLINYDLCNTYVVSITEMIKVLNNIDG